MVNDMLDEVYQALSKRPELTDICIKSFERPESLEDDKPSIVIRPVSSPLRVANGSNTSLAKRFTYQINVESTSRKECKEIWSIIEKVMEGLRFYQVAGDLEDYISHIKRYVDVRTYRGVSPLYKDY
ncbi:hypothetical protein Q7V72_03295 [Streptococcus suis]|nr:hypothetical protein [Streptococcus suis]HEM3878459.1 hypothetical protein [Streptococcus suis]HEM3895694.1 hypothetical protein [Streptococcus suis]HEM3903863.1 hypothetical protein [Streptococcus suis]